MLKDPIVEEVREIRRETEQRYGSSAAYFEHLDRLQQQWQERLVRRGPQPGVQAKVA
ncbi:MAG: hypothetical protein GY856_14550 [bacterium]|nr:hypothetical protein [bacterium]